MNQRVYLVILAAIIVIIYSPSLFGPYTLDDAHTIQGNGALHSWDNFINIWKSAKFYSSNPDNWGYRPLNTMSNLILWQVADGKTWPYHVFKIILFILVCILLVRIWQKIMGPKYELAVLGAGLIFAQNPVHSQVVCYISATSTLLAGTFVLLAIFSYLKYRESFKTTHLAGVWISIALSMLSKEEGITVIAIIPALEIYLRKTSGQKIFKNFHWFLNFGNLVVALLCIYLIFNMFEPTSDIARGSMDRLVYFQSQWRAYFRYLALFFVPINLNVDNLNFGFYYQRFETGAVLFGIANVVLILLALTQWKKRPLIPFVLFWFYSAISPSSSIIPLAEPVNDHRAFIAYFGMFGLLVPSIQYVIDQKKQFLIYALSAITLSYAGGTALRAYMWSNSEAIWKDTVEKNPNSPRAYNNLAVVYMAEGRYAESELLLSKCLVVGPQYGICYINRAISLAALGKDEEAEKYFKISTEYDRGFINSRSHWAQFLYNRGYFTRAIELLKEADSFAKGQNVFVRIEMINVLVNMGDLNGAKAIYYESRPLLGGSAQFRSLSERMKW